MSGKSLNMKLFKQCLLRMKQGQSNRQIAKELKINKDTVNRYAHLIQERNLKIDELLKLPEPELNAKFHEGDTAYTDKRMEVFLRELPMYIEKLEDKHVTRSQVWSEYKEEHPNGYERSQFLAHLRQHYIAKNLKSVAILNYAPGEKLMVDFAGDRLSYVDEETGEVTYVETFVASMPYSDYTFAVCVPSQRSLDFFDAIRMCLEFLGGVPKYVITDNLRAAVKKADRYEPDVNDSFMDFANHYGFNVLPCQPYRPTQKSQVENEVKLVYWRVYAKLRHITFHSLKEINDAILPLIKKHNQTRIQRRDCTREEIFHSKEKDKLQPLPEKPFEMQYLAHLTVQPNCLVELKRNKCTHYYSVPYIHVGKKALVMYTEKIVNIYVDNKLVATHKRSHSYGSTIVNEHLASYNQIQLDKSPEKYSERAWKVSPTFGQYIDEMFNPKRTNNAPEIYYKTIDMLFSLLKKYPRDLYIENCKICLDAKIFSGKRFENIIKATISSLSEEGANDTEAPTPTNHENMRGPSYYE